MDADGYSRLAFDPTDEKLPDLKVRIDELSALCEEWKKLRQHSVEMAVEPLEGDPWDELERRLDMANLDISLCIKCVNNAIVREKKTHQKQHDVYSMESRELALKLDRATEELELKDALSASIAQRQLQQMRPQLPPRPRPISSEPKAEQKYMSLNSHKLVLQRRRKELIEGLSARPVADVMFEKGAMTMQDLEAVQRSTETKSAEHIVDILLEQPYAVFHYFKEALRETQQNDIYMALTDIGK